DSTTWLENGNATGGTVTIIIGNLYQTPNQLGIAGINSTTYKANSPATVNITSFAPQRAPTAAPYLGATGLGNLATAGTPMLTVLVFGNLSLVPTGLVILPTGTFNNSTGSFEQNLPVGPLPAGVKVWMQSLVVDMTATKIYLSNTGKVEWK